MMQPQIQPEIQPASSEVQYVIPCFDVYGQMDKFVVNDNFKESHKELDDILNKQIHKILPSAIESTNMQTFISKVMNCLEYHANDPTNNVKIDKIKDISFLKLGMAINGQITGEISITLAEAPLVSHVSDLAQKCLEYLKSNFTKEMFIIEETDYGFNVKTTPILTIKCYITSKLMGEDASKQLKTDVLAKSWENLKLFDHLEQSEIRNETKNLIKLFKYLRSVNTVAENNLNDWALINMVLQNSTIDDEYSSIGIRFIKVLRVISSGLLMPGCTGILNPADDFQSKFDTKMDDEASDSVTKVFQEILNDILAERFGKHFIL